MFNSSQSCRLWPARLLCQGGSPGKNTGVYWSILVAIPFYSTIFPAALVTNPPEYLVAARTPVTQAAASPPHLALTGANPSPPGQPQEQTPEDDPHAEVEIKPQLKLRGTVAKEKYPIPSHKPSTCATFTLGSNWGRAATGKKVLHLCTQGHFGPVQLFATL